MIDDEANFDILDASEEVQAAAKFRPKQRAKPRKTVLSSRSAASNPTVENGNGQLGVSNRLCSSKELTSQERASLTCPGRETIDDVAGSQGILETPSADVLTVPLRAPGGTSAADRISQDDKHNADSSKLDMHKESLVIPDIQVSPATASSCGKIIDDIVEFEELFGAQDKEERVAKFQPKDADATVDLDNHNELINSPIDGTQPMVGEVPVEATCKSQPNVGREKGKGKSVSFAMSDSGVVTPTDTNSEIDNFSDSCNDKLTDENLSNLSQQTVQKNSNDQEHNEGEPLDPPFEQQPKSSVGETGSSMKLRIRKKSQKAGSHKDTDEYFGEDSVEPSLAQEDNDSGDDYTNGTTRKVRKKPRDSVEELLQQKVQKDKSQVSSRSRKRTLKDASVEKPKKLTHRIRQSRAKEVKTLLEKPREEIDPMKLSAAHLRLLQEARARVNGKEGKENPPEPSSNSSFQFDEMDDLDYGDEERNFDNDRTQNPTLNVKKLNYHSYMNKQTRGKWSKSDTDMFYKGLRQFGSDFAMIQQLLPDKTRHQVRAKFKTEEKKNPLLVHDAIINRSGDNLYFKKVIKNLNIEDVAQQEINNTHKQDGASSERGPEKEDVLDDFILGEDDDLNWLDEEHSVQKPDVQEEHASGNDDDGDLGNVFDWY